MSSPGRPARRQMWSTPTGSPQLRHGSVSHATSRRHMPRNKSMQVILSPGHRTAPASWPGLPLGVTDVHAGSSPGSAGCVPGCSASSCARRRTGRTWRGSGRACGSCDLACGWPWGVFTPSPARAICLAGAGAHASAGLLFFLIERVSLYTVADSGERATLSAP